MSMVPRSNVIKALGASIDASIGSLIGNRVYFTQEAPQDKEYPLCTYFGIGDVPQYDMNKESLDSEFQINIFDLKDKGSLSLNNIGDTLINDLSRAEIDIIGYVNEDIQILEAGRIQVEDEYLHLIIEIRILGFPI